MKATWLFMAVVVFAGWAGAAQALIMAYGNLADWTAAIGGAPVVSDPFDNDIRQEGVITFDSGVKSAFLPVGFITDNSVLRGRFFIAIGGDPHIASPANIWRFPTPIFAFGFDFYGIAAAAGTSVLIDDGSGPVSFELLAAGVGDSRQPGQPVSPRLGGDDGFAGFVSDSGAFTEVSFYSQFDKTDAYQLDNLVFASRIPAPGGFALFSLGLAGLGWIQHRPSKPAVSKLSEQAG